MRELTLTEINNVSGGTTLASRLEGALVWGINAGFVGSVWGGTRGGDGGGILGIGSIGQGVGMVYGGVVGLVGGLISGFIYGKERAYAYSDGFMGSLFNGTFAK
ncbi:hypothetical protein [Xylella fastidiosa]|uniref:hypothetical protein n=1 Tax=Xylella fastidiosa TaxID=2371 RepID=UPI0003D2B360|nr:hypothetical protein [Xylella fastidiosa]ALQ96225.1 colicin V synthesis protein [Xylella fastidiosa]ALR01075.1 colicin V synthesis protein [Xylella fastidiosa]ETE35923.1 colicin V synthesis protein [Xylella fastidiosa 32]KXB14884.1 colicin V synthesis protein [Xylella fastidiosa]KXB18904.1 colicin V synthesis protein [Xylella fastidiosa]